MNNYFYQIGRGLTFDTLKEARLYQKHILKKDTGTIMLYRDNKGYYILKRYVDGRVSIVIR